MFVMVESMRSTARSMTTCNFSPANPLSPRLPSSPGQRVRTTWICSSSSSALSTTWGLMLRRQVERSTCYSSSPQHQRSNGLRMRPPTRKSYPTSSPRSSPLALSAILCWSRQGRPPLQQFSGGTQLVGDRCPPERLPSHGHDRSRANTTLIRCDRAPSPTWADSPAS